MTSKKKNSGPLTFDLDADLLRKIDHHLQKHNFSSRSEVIRDAIDSFDYSSYEPEPDEHRQISVRLMDRQKDLLSHVAKDRRVSLAELLRVALKALPDSSK